MAGEQRPDMTKGNKVAPTTKAKPYGGAGAKGSPDHGSPGESKPKKK